MSDDEQRHFYGDNISAIASTLSDFEGWHQGGNCRLAFTTIGYDGLMILGHGGYGKLGYGPRLPGLDEFAKDLNAAMKPVIDAYVIKLRRAAADECARQMVKALHPLEDRK